MNLAILAKTWRETRVLLAIVFVAIVGFELVFVWAVSTFAKELTDIWFKFPFLKKLIAALAGADLASDVTITALMSLGMAHPILFALTWAFILTLCTRVIVGEIERGTADLLLTLPASRTSVFAAVSLVWAAVGLPFCAAPWCGISAGRAIFAKAAEIDIQILWIPTANLYALYLAIGCFTLAVGSFMTRRGVAIGIVLGILIAMFVLNFVTALVPGARPWGVLGMLNYYRPLESIRARALPTADIAVLLAIAAAAWTVGLVRFRTRDIPAS
jgi:ABC-type transport system involved in multi-copper enzyme maturation permease subunit